MLISRIWNVSANCLVFQVPQLDWIRVLPLLYLLFNFWAGALNNSEIANSQCDFASATLLLISFSWPI